MLSNNWPAFTQNIPHLATEGVDNGLCAYFELKSRRKIDHGICCALAKYQREHYTMFTFLSLPPNLIV